LGPKLLVDEEDKWSIILETLREQDSKIRGNKLNKNKEDFKGLIKRLDETEISKISRLSNEERQQALTKRYIPYFSTYNDNTYKLTFYRTKVEKDWLMFIRVI